MPPERELERHTFVERAGAAAVWWVLPGEAAGASEKPDDGQDTDWSDHLTPTGTDAHPVVGVDRDSV